MTPEILERLSGEELLLLTILNGESVRPAIEAELDRRARFGRPWHKRPALKRPANRQPRPAVAA